MKAVSSFHCRLCGLHIKEASGVIPHIDSRLHQNNYQVGLCSITLFAETTYILLYVLLYIQLEDIAVVVCKFDLIE